MPKAGKSYLTRFDESFNGIGDVDGDTAPPRYNDLRSRVAAELSIAARLRTMANSRYERAKSAFAQHYAQDITTVKSGNGKTGLFSNTFCGVVAYKRVGSPRLDKAKLINTLVTQHNFTMDKATKLIDECSKKDNDALILDCTIFDKA